LTVNEPRPKKERPQRHFNQGGGNRW